MEKQINDLLKKLIDGIGNIHDNYGTILGIERQKRVADPSLLKSLDEQIKEVKKVLQNNQNRVNKILDEICTLSDTYGKPLSEDCRKLDTTYKSCKDNPDIIQIQKGIDLIKKDLKNKPLQK